MQRARKRRNYRLRRSRRMAAASRESVPVRSLVSKFAKIWFDRALGREPVVQKVERATWRDIGSLDGVVAFQFFTAGEDGQNAEQNTPMSFIGAEQLDFKEAVRKYGHGHVAAAWLDLNVHRERDFAVRLADGSWMVALLGDTHYDRDGSGLRMRRNFGDGLEDEPAKTAAFASV